MNTHKEENEYGGLIEKMCPTDGHGGTLLKDQKYCTICGSRLKYLVRENELAPLEPKEEEIPYCDHCDVDLGVENHEKDCPNRPTPPSQTEEPRHRPIRDELEEVIEDLLYKYWKEHKDCGDICKSSTDYGGRTTHFKFRDLIDNGGVNKLTKE